MLVLSLRALRAPALPPPPPRIEVWRGKYRESIQEDGEEERSFNRRWKMFFDIFNKEMD